MGIKESMWQYLDYGVFKLKYCWIDTWEQFQFDIRLGFLCHLFCNPKKYSWTHWPSCDWAAKLLIDLICPRHNRPNYQAHALARFLSSCQTVELHTWNFFSFFPSSLNPSSPEALGSALHTHSWVQHHHSWSTSTETTTASSSCSLSHGMHLLCLMARQPCLQSFVAVKPFRGIKWVLVPLWFSLGTLLPKPIGLQCVERGWWWWLKQWSLATVWNGTNLKASCVSSAPGQQQAWLV